MMLKSVLAAAALVMATALPVQADDQLPTNVSNDLHCLVVGFNMAGGAGDNAQAQTGGQILAIYYLGRLKAEAPNLNLEDASYTIATQMTEQSFNTDRQRCAGEFTVVGQDLITMGQHMMARGQAEQPHQ